MFDNIAAIDIGYTSIKMILAKTTIKNFKVELIIHQNIDFSIEDHNDAIIDALSSLLEKHDLSQYKVLTNLPIEKTIIRNLAFPFNDYEQIAEVIPFEAQENIPFQIDDLNLDFQFLQNTSENGSKVLLAAAHNDIIDNFTDIFKTLNVKPHIVGLESNSLHASYSYFNDIANENIIQLDIGHNKTIMNIVSNDQLLFTRSISIGTGVIVDSISKSLKIPYNKALNLYENLRLDLTSLDNNYKKTFYKDFKISKPKLRTIYDNAVEIIHELTEQILLTIKSFYSENYNIDFNRILISGGGTNLTGIGNIITKLTGIPIMSLPFTTEYKENMIQTQFPISFGIILAYLNTKKQSINFIKNNLSSARSFQAFKKYYLAAFFTIIACTIFLVNLIISSISQSNKETHYNEILTKQFKKYFRNKQIGEDPIASAKEILSKEKSALNQYKAINPPEMTALGLLTDIISYFPSSDSFKLKNLVINKKVVKINGEIASSNVIDEFKNKLIDSKKFDSVRLNTSMTKQNYVRFSLVIKLKLDSKKSGKNK